MKKNLILTSILIALISFTYFFQEKKMEDLFSFSLTEGRLIKEDINKLTLPNIKAQKINGEWFENDQLLSHNAFKQIETKLKSIKELKKIGMAPAGVFGNAFSFDINGVNWKIAGMSLDGEGFYISKGNITSLAIIDAGNDTAATENENLEELKRTELLELLSRPKEALIEKQLFRYYPDLGLEKIIVHAQDRLAYEVDLIRETTSPPPIKGVEIRKGLKDNFLTLLTQVQIRNEIPGELERFKLMSEVSLVGAKKTVKWELWLKSREKADAVIFDETNSRAFLMSGGTLKFFFLNVQDYWDKKVIPPSEFKSFNQTQAIFTQGSRSTVVEVMNREPLEFKSKSRIKVDEMRDLFQIIFNLGPRDQADRVSQLTSSDKKLYLSGNYLHVQILGQELIVIKRPEEIIVANLTHDFKAHFGFLDEKFNARYEDVLD